ncbi:hypothetical protein C0J52_11672 [Blattella germanica]|nr:hypothetical protein C0J52_11672 [Blattella germanica]
MVNSFIESKYCEPKEGATAAMEERCINLQKWLWSTVGKTSCGVLKLVQKLLLRGVIYMQCVRAKRKIIKNRAAGEALKLKREQEKKTI